MNLEKELQLILTRRQLFSRASVGIGTAALASLLPKDLLADTTAIDPKTGGLADLPHFAPKAKRVIFLHQSGAPSQVELFDYKPNLKKLHGTELPDSIRRGQRITGMTSGQDSFPVAAPIFSFKQHGKSGTWLSELLPHTAKIVDDIAIIKTMNTDAINHDPAITFIQSGSQQPGRPSMGSWVSYGLGQREPELACLCRAALTGERTQHRPAIVLPALGQRIFALPLSRSPLPCLRRPGALSRRCPWD